MAKEQRPVPLPNRQGTATTPASGSATPPPAKRPVRLPPGASMWSKSYVTEDNRHVSSKTPVPIDNAGRIVAVDLWCCPEEGCTHETWRATGSAFEPMCRTHGVPLVLTDPEDKQEPSTPLLPWDAMWRAVEPSLRPAYVLAGEYVVGAAEYLGNVSPLLPAAGTVVLAGSAYTATRLHLMRRAIANGRLEKGQRTGRRVNTINRRARLAAYIAAQTGACLTAVAFTDPHTFVGKTMWAALVVSWAVSWAPWWRYLDRLRNRPVAPPADVTTVPVADTPDSDRVSAEEAAKRWDEDAGFPNTKLDPDLWKRTPFGWQAVVAATKRGALNGLGGENMKATVKKIAAAYDVPRSAIAYIEEHEENPNRAMLLVQPNNPLKEGQIWGGPDSIRITKRGIEAEVGRLINGDPMIEVLYRFGWGAPSAVTLGTTGSGKSERLRKKLVIERYTSVDNPDTSSRRGLFLSFLHDPKRLEAYAEFRHAVHGYGITRDDAHIMVDAFLREMIRRYDFLAGLKWTDGKGRKRQGGVPWNPLVHGPIISVIWDEFHELAGDKEFVAKLEKLGRYQRACGMRAELASHMATIGDTGSQALRDMLAGGRATLLRTTSGLNAALATGGQLTGDPRTLPKQPGMCYASDGETATLIGRESYIPGDENQYDVTLYDWLFNDANEPVGYPAEIPPETVEAFGKDFMKWCAAGRSEQGRIAPAVTGSTAGATPVTPVDDLRAQEVLRQILLRAGSPMKREDIAKHPDWKFGVTSTLTDAFRAGQDAHPPWLIKVKNGVYDLTLPMRQQMQAAAEEEKEPAAA